jgi:AbrB family looped-hinge helix DNA binding protein
MRVGPDGRVTIPADLRASFGFLPGTAVEFVVQDDGVKIVPATQAGNPRGDRVVHRLRGRAVSRLTTDQILALTRGP